MEYDPARRAVAEFVGTFALVFVAVGAIMVSGQSGLVGVALATGLVIAVMASALGHISGGHFNPAVTLGFVVTRRMAPLLAVVYWLAQVLAAVSAALLLRYVFPPEADLAGGVPTLNESVDLLPGLVLEALFTFFLVWVIFATAADPRGSFTTIAGLGIGLTITFATLVAGPLTGAALNPARAFGPELVEGEWSNWWIYYVGPFVGGAVAALGYDLLYLRRPAVVPPGPPETGLEEPRPGDAAA